MKSSKHPKITSSASIAGALRRQKKAGRKIVFTNGCFDILHVGHVSYLEEAKALGDVLVVGLNKDRSVKRLKGPHRPLIKEGDRARVLASLGAVDYVVPFGEATPERLIRAVKPDFLVKGGDWQKKDIVGSRFVESYGGKVRSLKFVNGISTSALIEKIRRL